MRGGDIGAGVWIMAHFIGRLFGFSLDMGMIVEFLRPRMQDREHARCAADLLRIFGEADNGAGRGLDQRTVALSLTPAQ